GSTRIGAYFRPSDYLGIIQLPIHSFPNDLVIEVASRKLDYFYEYEQLLDEVSKHNINLINEIGSSSSALTKSNVNEQGTLISKYFYLRYLMSDENLPACIEYLQSSLTNSLETELLYTSKINGKRINQAQISRSPHKLS